MSQENNAPVTQWFEELPVHEGDYEVKHIDPDGTETLLMHYFNGTNFEPAERPGYVNDVYLFMRKFGDTWRGLADKPASAA